MLEDVNNLSVTVNGQSKVPPGFRFHPTEEELLHYYLTKKVASQKIDLDVIREIDLNKLEPWDIQETCKIGSSSTPQNEWYLFSHKDKKYPTGTRTNRATAAGFWKATGRDKVIHNCSFSRIGMRKTLVFYRGRAPHGLKSDWIMHEYRLIHNNEKENNMSITITITNPNSSSHYSGDQSDQGWVVCRVFKKKNYHKKSMDHHSRLSITSRSNEEGNMMLDHILTSSNSSSSSCKQENDEFNNNTSTPLMFPNNLIPSTTHYAGNFMHLPGLECPDEGLLISEIGPCSDWAAVDRLVASQLNGQPTNDDDHDEARLLHTMMMMMNSSSDYNKVILPPTCYDDHLHDVPNSSLWDHFGHPSLSSSDPLSRFSI